MKELLKDLPALITRKQIRSRLGLTDHDLRKLETSGRLHPVVLFTNRKFWKNELVAILDGNDQKGLRDTTR